MKRKKIVGIIVLLLLVCTITIGYSLLSDNLSINGTSSISSTSWNIHFADISPTTGSVTPTTAPTIDDSGLNITYAVAMTNPGDFYEFTVKVVNSGTVNAKMSSLPVLTGVSSSQDVFTNFTYTHADGTAITNIENESINAGQSKTYKVRVEFDRNISSNQLPTTIQNMTLKVALAYEQA